MKIESYCHDYTTSYFAPILKHSKHWLKTADLNLPHLYLMLAVTTFERNQDLWQ